MDGNNQIDVCVFVLVNNYYTMSIYHRIINNNGDYTT
ncbi:TPA: hypothetical protein OV973_002214 [Staphylococcus aureus]|nr:hypothetical protein [Staphylococcus aureus]MCJ8110808.1 hypothetical protein [Staphylococcus aureus]MDQ1784758.1 hypothetical protein [Staphylococcus aureus]QHK50474.1 hypothetical protein E3S88_07925 [Staphylococcus aureus]RQX56017.1 hypothetical protein DB789_02345 [Staphylococcus aureus]HBC4295670.1 hypothetical protein [Staphylococcus aureus]